MGEKDDKYLANLKNFSAPRLRWAGYSPGLVIRKCEFFSSRK